MVTRVSAAAIPLAAKLYPHKPNTITQVRRNCDIDQFSVEGMGINPIAKMYNHFMDDVIPTGSLRLDIALSTGGVPRGHITEIAGDASSGKTTICQHILAEAHRLGGRCALIDSDHMFDPRYAEQCGVILNQLYLTEPESAEQALETAHIMAQSGAFMAIAIDSLTSLTPLAELNTPLGVSIPGSIESLLSKWLPQLIAAIQNSQAALLVTGQTQPGMSAVYHDLESHLTRLALPLSAAVRLKLNSISDPNVGRPVQRIQVKIIKNKFAPCFKTIDLDIIVNKGINKTGELLDLGEEFSIFSRQGPQYVYRGFSLGARREDVNEYLCRHPQMAAEIEQAIRQRLRL
jgi:recombination protein RecA